MDVAEDAGRGGQLAEIGRLLADLAREGQGREDLIALLARESGVRPMFVRLAFGIAERLARRAAAAVEDRALAAAGRAIARIPGVDKLLAKLRELVGTVDARAKLEADLRAFAAGTAPRPELPDDTPADTALALAILKDLRELPDLAQLRDEITRLADRLEDRLGPKPMLVTHEETGQVLEYRRRAMPFLGREREIDCLRSFAHEEAPFRWALVTGAGGVGKSRLALELCIELREERSWRTGFLGRDDGFDRWMDWHPARPTLIVFDYVQERVEDVAKCLAALYARTFDPGTLGDRPLDAPVRVLLLERETGDADRPADWWRQLRDKLPSGAFEPEAHFDDPLLRLQTITDDALYKAMQDLAGDGLPPPAETLAALARVDPQRRPLFAAMLVEFWKERRRFEVGREELLDWVVERELRRVWGDRWTAVDASVLGEQNLLALATMVGGVPWQEVNALPPELRRYYPKSMGLLPEPRLTRAFSDAWYDAGNARVRPLEPDIIGGWFALGHPRSCPGGRNATIAALRDSVWRMTTAQYEGFFAFLSRTAEDFPTEIAKAANVLLEAPSAVTASTRLAEFTWAAAVVNAVSVLASCDGCHDQVGMLFARLWRCAETRKFDELWEATGRAAFPVIDCLARDPERRDRAYEVFEHVWQLARQRDNPHIAAATVFAAATLVFEFAPDPDLRDRAEEAFERLWQIAGTSGSATGRAEAIRAAAFLIVHLATDPARAERACEIFERLWNAATPRELAELGEPIANATESLVSHLASDPDPHDRVRRFFERLWELAGTLGRDELWGRAVRATVYLGVHVAADPQRRNRADEMFQRLSCLAESHGWEWLWERAARAPASASVHFSGGPAQGYRSEEMSNRLSQLAGTPKVIEGRGSLVMAPATVVARVTVTPVHRDPPETVVARLLKSAHQEERPALSGTALLAGYNLALSKTGNRAAASALAARLLPLAERPEVAAAVDRTFGAGTAARVAKDLRRLL